MEDANARRRRDLEEILELRRSFGTLGRRLVSRQGPIQPGLVPFQRPSAEADRDLDARPDEELDQEQDQDQDQDQVSTTVRRIAPFIDESYHVPDPPAPAGDEALQIPDPPPARRRPPWPWLVGLAAVVFALGMAVDHTVLQPAPRPAPPVSTPVQVTSAPSSSVAPAGPRVSVPQACLVTAQRGDALIDMLVNKTRGLEVTKALKSYTEASQTCRKEASSR